jgi:hypothetical protein
MNRANQIGALELDQTIAPLGLSAGVGAVVLSALSFALGQNGWSAVILLPLVVLFSWIVSGIFVLLPFALWPRMRRPSYPFAAIWGFAAACLAASLFVPTLSDMTRWPVLLVFGSAGAAAGLLYSYLAHRRSSAGLGCG